MITKRDLKYLRLAETMAAYSDYPRVKIGSCVVRKKSVVSTGCNKSKTNPEQKKYNRLLPYEIKKPRLHAEIDSLIKAGEESKGATLYIFRRGHDGAYRNCKPCAACMGKIRDSEVKRVVYTVFNGVMEMNFYSEKTK